MIGWPIFRFLSFPISFLFPGYLSFKAVLTEGGDDDTRWLCYWVIIALLFFFETTFSLIVASFPFYYEFKCVLLMILQWNSAAIPSDIFHNWLEPLLTYVEPTIDAFLERYSQKAIALAKKGKGAVDKAVQDAARAEAEKAIKEKIEEAF